MKYWFKNVADNIYIYPKSAPRNLILQTRTSDCNSANSANSTYIYAKKNNKYITRYNEIDTKAKKYI